MADSADVAIIGVGLHPLGGMRTGLRWTWERSRYVER